MPMIQENNEAFRISSPNSGLMAANILGLSIFRSQTRSMILASILPSDRCALYLKHKCIIRNLWDKSSKFLS